MWRDYINRLEKEWIGKKVEFNGKQYKIVKVDYNGILHINKKSEHNETTAVYEVFEAKKHLIGG